MFGGPKEKAWNTTLADYKQWRIVSVCLSLGHRTETEPRPLVRKAIVCQLLACPLCPLFLNPGLRKWVPWPGKLSDLTILTSSSHPACPLNHIYEHRLI